MDLTLRQATAADVVRITELVNSAYRPKGNTAGWTHEADLVSGSRISPEQLQQLLVNSSVILLLCHGKDIVACVHLQPEGETVYVGMLATDPEFQARGYGKQMLHHAEEYASKHFQAKVLNMSVLSVRKELISFYERRGYVKTGNITNYPEDTGVGIPRMPNLYVMSLIKQLSL